MATRRPPSARRPTSRAAWPPTSSAPPRPRPRAPGRRPRRGGAAAAARAFVAQHPASAARAQAEAAERAALARRVEQRRATPDERARLVALLSAWATDAPPDDAATPWLAVGEVLLEAGALDAAERALARVDGPGRDVAALRRATLARARGDLDAAERLLQGLDPTRADVVLERGALLRARGRPREALEGYLALLRGLEAERPPVWWEAAIGAAEAYAELGDPGQARALLDGLRRKDPTFGGDEPRRRRIVDLMVRLDAAR
ncbi:MAG: hypothetical protein M9894_21135 [Planctomycetes bacterium]|nr:hypothetical protein [Planctomycetota bacterium]